MKRIWSRIFGWLPGRTLDRWGRFRVILLGITVLLAIQLLAVASAVRERSRDTGQGFRFPLPAQAAAMAQMINAASPEELPLILSAVNSPDIRVVVLDAASPAAQIAPDVARIPDLERIVENYAAALAPLEVSVYLAAEPGETTMPRVIKRRLGYVLSDRPLRLDIMLSGDRVLRLETRGDLTMRIFGWPLGLAAGMLGAVLAAIAVWAMWREVRPLSELSARVDRFARAARPQMMQETGPEEIRSVIAAFNRMQTRVAELMEARSVMLGALGHDLRTYLTRLRLRADFVDNETQQTRMIQDLDAMESVIAASTRLARLEGPPGALDETALAPILEDLKKAHPDLRFAPKARDSDVVVWGDRDAIHLALDNLISNAKRYGAQEDGAEADVEIAIEIEDDPLGQKDPMAHIMVLDRGAGISASDAGRLFEPFVRGDAARNLNAPGSGLGLAIVAAVARAHRGSAQLQNRSGGGLEARLSLPVPF